MLHMTYSWFNQISHQSPYYVFYAATQISLCSFKITPEHLLPVVVACHHPAFARSHVFHQRGLLLTYYVQSLVLTNPIISYWNFLRACGFSLMMISFWFFFSFPRYYVLRFLLPFNYSLMKELNKCVSTNSGSDEHWVLLYIWLVHLWTGWFISPWGTPTALQMIRVKCLRSYGGVALA